MAYSIGIIPARMASSRLPGKPLVSICGMPMVGHVYHRSKMSHSLDDVYMETIELNRHIESDSQNMNTFVPFHGTPLRKMAEELNLVQPEEITKCLTDNPMMDMPQFSAKEIAGLIKCFVLYVKFPKSRWEDIQRAEEDTPEGRKIFKELKEEFVEKYMPSKSDANPKEIPIVADLEYGMESPLS